MIKANELRVGNWLLTDEDEMLQVNEIKQDFNGYEYTITFITSDDMYHDSIISECNPIPLTEEILLKCGFVRLDSVAYVMPHIDRFIFDMPIFEDGLFRYGVNHISIKSLHQIQNLYFALTGEELNVEL